MHTHRFLFAFLLLPLAAAPLSAQILVHPDPTLHYVFPAGGQQGQTVAVELGGLSGLTGAKGVILDGPPGITVRDVKAVSDSEVRATFVIAPDAPPGCRLVRVVGGANGLTNFRHFFVGRLPEITEKEPNNTQQNAQEVTLPVVVNGRLNPNLDVDCFSFTAGAGQPIVAAVLAHRMDSRLRTRTGGYLDTSLELLDSRGKVVAAAEDTLGLDPVLEYTAPAAGRYTIRVQALSFEGAPSAVYRLTLGTVAYPTTVFPPGGQRGRKVEVELHGPLVKSGTRRRVEADASNASPWQEITPDHDAGDGRTLPFVWGHHPEIIEVEPNDDLARATPLSLPVTVNARFDRPNDVDYYRLTLKKGEGVLLEVTAQRHLRSPVDTLLQVVDRDGKVLAENDDGTLFAGQCEADFPSSDSRLEFTAPADGDYFVRLSDQNGVSGPRAIYRLTAEALRPDFALHHWPDAVRIWGPGTSAAFVVQVQRWGGLKGDVRLGVEGLPPGWTGSIGSAPAVSYLAPNAGSNQKVLLTISAPADAAVGSTATFRVVGRVEEDGRTIEHVAQAQTWYGSSHTKRMHLRHSPRARAVVADYRDCWLETSVRELTVMRGETVKFPVRVHRKGPAGKGGLALSVDGETPAASSAWRIAQTLKADENEVTLTLDVSKRLPGTYGIVVSRSWSSDLRGGQPGPCTPLILLHVRPPK